MKVSVIVPCYNAQRYLAPCLDAVLAQSVADFEVLLIDDGSTDGTAAIAARYAMRDARVRVFRQSNAGVSAARNLGLSHARGEWVTFVDSDDLLTPDALAVMLAAAGKGVDMVVCAHETFDENGAREIVYPQTRWIDRQGDTRRRAAAKRLIEGDCVLNIMCGKLHRRSLIEREALRLAPHVSMAEDALFNLEAALCGHGIAYVNRVVYRYRMHDASATHARAGSEWALHLPWLTAMRDMLLRRGEMERYYAAFVDSAALRLYKDGGVRGVMREFDRVRALCDVPLHPDGLSAGGRLLRALVCSGAYPLVYPLIWPVQVMKRKLCEAAARLRAPKERPR